MNGSPDYVLYPVTALVFDLLDYIGIMLGQLDITRQINCVDYLGEIFDCSGHLFE